MSPGSRVTPAERAINTHIEALEHCWVITGPDRPGVKPSSRENAMTLQERYQGTHAGGMKFHIRELQDADDPKETYYLVRSVYEEAQALRLSEKNVVADYTGGTKSMTAGMVLACSISEDRDAQYMKASTVTAAGIAEDGATAMPILIDLHFESRS